MGEKYLGQLTAKSAPATGDILVLEDSEDTKKIDYDALANAILNKLTTKTYTVAGGTNTLIAAIDALNNKTKAYDYTAQSGSFLDWVSSTFTTNGEYYVVIATLNSVGLPRSSTGIATVTKRNSDIYIHVVYGSKDEYIATYVSNAWTEWTKYPTRAEVDALSNKLGRLITSGSLHDILTPGIYYIGSSVTDQPVQQSGYGGTYIVSSANENTLVGTYISMYDKSIWSTAKLNAAWTYTQMAKHVALSPTLSGCGSGSSIHAVQIGTAVVVTAKIKYSGTNVTISGLPTQNGDTQNGFVIMARDQTDGSVARMWTNGSSNILKIDDLTTDHMYGMSYTYIIA